MRRIRMDDPRCEILKIGEIRYTDNMPSAVGWRFGSMEDCTPWQLWELINIWLLTRAATPTQASSEGEPTE